MQQGCSADQACRGAAVPVPAQVPGSGCSQPLPGFAHPNPPLHCSLKHSPLETNVPPTCKSTGFLHTYLSLSYTSLCIYISYIQCVLLRFLEKISFPKRHRLCQAGSVEIPEGSRSSLAKKSPQPRTTAEPNPNLRELLNPHPCPKQDEKPQCQAGFILTRTARSERRQLSNPRVAPACPKP